MSKKKCLIILSNKSSGSSACQNLLAKFADVKHVRKTRHFENETLYWTKAASILGLPQKPVLDSEVPLEPGKARADLIEILQENTSGFVPPEDKETLIFEGWRHLCYTYAPIFLEKSPHHLYQRSALELMVEGTRRLDDVDFLFIGLIRNPVDTLYSAFNRWKTIPEQAQFEWLEAYTNLLNLKEDLGDRVVLLRYEDMVTSLQSIEPILKFCGTSQAKLDPTYLHRGSLQKWKQDKTFGFVLDAQVFDLAKRYGYSDEELDNSPKPSWHFSKRVQRIGYKAKTSVKQAVKSLYRS